MVGTAQLCQYTKGHCFAHFKRVSVMVCECHLTKAVDSVWVCMTDCACVCACVSCATFEQGGAAERGLPLALTDLPACGFENQIIGSEAAKQLSLGTLGLPGFIRKQGPATVGCGRYRGCLGGEGVRFWWWKATQDGPGLPLTSRPWAPLISDSTSRYLLSAYTVPGTGAATTISPSPVPKPRGLFPRRLLRQSPQAACLPHSSPALWGWGGGQSPYPRPRPQINGNHLAGEPHWGPHFPRFP